MPDWAEALRLFVHSHFGLLLECGLHRERSGLSGRRLLVPGGTKSMWVRVPSLLYGR
jgi:hypothetical protein